ncbi:unnamed protein product [Schistosoma margrebowiei]|uniref:Uncharacterized protein n=1 Tax=Schistosoma margrebowiei TaxID=48269 RepID=A0AA84ZQL4_9TREM|nr:unnamed protein product [Schistosoma margrebowiei]
MTLSTTNQTSQYGAPSAPVKSPDQQPAAPAASDSPAAPDKPAAASAKPDSPATAKSTARPKPSKRAQRPAYPPRSPARVRNGRKSVQVTVLIFAFVVNYLDVVNCDGDGAPSAPVKSPDQQPAAPAASDSPAAPDKPAAASAKPDSPATTKSTARPKPSKRAQRPAYPPRSPARVRRIYQLTFEVTVLTFAFVVNYLDVVNCDGDGAPSAPVKSPDQQPAAPAASDSPAAPDKPAAASAKPDSPATTKSTARPKPSKRAQRPAYPPRSPPRLRSPRAPTHPRKY